MLNAFCLFFLRENLQSYQFYKSVHCEMDCLYCIGGSRRVTEGNRVNLGIKGTAWDIEIWNYGLKNSRGVKGGGERKMTSCGVGGRRISKKKMKMIPQRTEFQQLTISELSKNQQPLLLHICDLSVFQHTQILHWFVGPIIKINDK